MKPICFLASIVLLSIVSMVVYYFVALHKGEIKDENKNFIPDPVEDAAKRIKERYDQVAKEVKDVADAVKGKNKK